MKRRLLSGIVAACAAIALPFAIPAAPVSAQGLYTYFDLYAAYTQSGSTTQTLDGYFLDRTFTTNLSDQVNSVTLLSPGSNSPTILNQVGPEDYDGSNVSYSSIGALQSAFPFGQYEFAYSGGMLGSGSIDFDYSRNIDPPPTTPEFTGGTYDSVQDYNTSQGYTFTFTPLVNDASQENPNIDCQFFIDDVTTDSIAYEAGVLNEDANSIFVPSSSLKAGDTYAATISFSRYATTATANANEEQAFYEVDTINFNTLPTPEASTFNSFGTVLLTGIIIAALKRHKAAKL